MSTSRNVTTLRVLLFLPAIPLLLLFQCVRWGDPGAAPGISSGDRSLHLSHSLPPRIPWQDDVMTPGLPASQPIGKRTVRKLVPARVIAMGKPAVVHPGFRPGSRIVVSSSVDSLAESLHLGRPPPTIVPSDGNGAGKGTTA